MQDAITFEDAPENETGDLRENALRWMEANPGIIALFERFSLEFLTRQRTFGMRLVAERVRWECAFTYATDFKICNNHTPYVARELVKRHPKLADFLRFRRTKYEK